ncbi:hypothetical protein [Thermotalea metallivorans]|uniref:Tetratricopeptide repeat protein n=1 Tax=Thermotalea metallivorans TaxID=520762 RepID=A0A140LBI1_9FIRM|nr:hypothetical protein [Thermotalea metallivorans]KXG77906.1 hypothetical protein AN619_03610 [Thermotalea metallivorans]
MCRKLKKEKEICQKRGVVSGIVLLIVIVNFLLYISYDKLFYKTGISKNLFMNSTLLGTTTGFTFPFLAFYYNFKNIAVLYLVIMITAVIMLSSKHTTLVPEGNGYSGFKLSLGKKNLVEATSVWALPSVPYTAAVEISGEADGILEAAYEEEAEMDILGEYFDALYMENAVQEESNLPVEEEMELPKEADDYFRKAIKYENEGNYLKALEGFMQVLKMASEPHMKFKSCLHIASLYKGMGQSKQAENVLYCLLQQYKEQLQMQQVEEIVRVLKS